MNSGKRKPKMPGKKPSHRNAIRRSLLIELVRGEKLQTTPKKAKLLKGEFDQLVNTAKKSNISSKREVETMLGSDKLVAKLYDRLLPRLDGNSGFTLSARTLPRKGDNAEQVIVMIKGHELKEKTSRISQQLAKQEKKAEAKSVTGRIKDVVAKPLGARNTKKKGQLADTRRVST